MKMHYTISPIGFVPNANGVNARGVSRLTGSLLSVTHTTAPAHGACPQPSGRIRRF